MRIVKLGLPTLLIVTLVSSLSFAAVDRIAGAIDSNQIVALRGNVHGFAKPQFDQGRADGSRLIEGVSLSFRPSPAQQKDLDQLLATLQDPTSPNYHKFLTPEQFGARFGMSQNDVKKVVAWLAGQGFKNIAVAPSRNEISFDGTVAQVELSFRTEMHTYLVKGETHTANATEPVVPAALGGAVIGMRHLHDFAPKPRVQVRPNLTSFVSGNHFLSPADFATIYNLGPLYAEGSDGTGQKIAVVGQTTVATTDLNAFRSAAGLPASTVTMTLMEGTATRCGGDEGESDLDLEWSGGIAKKASITFVYAGLGSGDTCTSRVDSVWDALHYSVVHNVAPFISISYGFCETGLGSAFAGPGGTLQTWAQEGQAQGQTIVSASGDAGAADCDGGSQAGTHGLTVDAPAVIPEVTGAGGTTFTGDVAGTVTGTPPNTTAGGDAPYWSGSGTGTDTISTALIYIPETGWNDTALSIANNGPLSATGGGASAFFSKPSWQTGTGVPADGKRDVPDISVSASPNHDGYLFCSEDGGSSIVTTCTSGFRTGAGGNFSVVGGTSAAAPTLAAILTLINQHVGNVPPAGLAPVNPTLYQLAASHPTAFHDVTTGNNIVPCTSGTTGCPVALQYGFSAGVGYDQVTGLGSVDAFALAQVFPGALPATTTTLVAAPTSIVAGDTVTLTATVTPSTATGNVNFFVGGTTALGSSALNSSGVAVLTTTSLPAGTDSVTATYVGDSANAGSTSTAVTVTVAGPDFAIAVNPTSGSVVAGTYDRRDRDQCDAIQRIYWNRQPELRNFAGGRNGLYSQSDVGQRDLGQSGGSLVHDHNRCEHGRGRCECDGQRCQRWLEPFRDLRAYRHDDRPELHAYAGRSNLSCGGRCQATANVTLTACRMDSAPRLRSPVVIRLRSPRARWVRSLMARSLSRSRRRRLRPGWIHTACPRLAHPLRRVFAGLAGDCLRGGIA